MIAKNHLLPKQKERHGLKKTQLRVPDSTLREIITERPEMFRNNMISTFDMTEEEQEKYLPQATASTVGRTVG